MGSFLPYCTPDPSPACTDRSGLRLQYSDNTLFVIYYDTPWSTLSTVTVAAPLESGTSEAHITVACAFLGPQVRMGSLQELISSSVLSGYA